VIRRLESECSQHSAFHEHYALLVLNSAIDAQYSADTTRSRHPIQSVKKRDRRGAPPSPPREGTFNLLLVRRLRVLVERIRGRVRRVMLRAVVMGSPVAYASKERG